MNPTRLLDAYVREFIATKLGDVTPGQITAFRLEAEPGRVWSEYTEESFSCHIVATTDQLGQDNERHLWLSESETCDFLNGYGEAASR